MTTKTKAAGVLVTPTTAHNNHACIDHSTGALTRRHAAFIATRGDLCIAALRVRGYEVVRHNDGSYHATHQSHSQHLADFQTLELFARSLDATLADGGAST